MNPDKPQFEIFDSEKEISPEFMEALEKSPFSPEDQVWILLTKAGLKPASWPDFVIRNEANGKINKKLSEEEVQRAVSLIQSNFPCKIERKIIDIKKDPSGADTVGGNVGVKVGEEEQISFMVGSTSENLEKLSLAVESKSDREIGLSLGFSQSAVEAYCTGKTLDMDKLPEEVLLSKDYYEAFMLNPGKLSADNWKEELRYYQRWADYIKKTSPKIYNKLIGFRTEK